MKWDLKFRLELPIEAIIERSESEEEAIRYLERILDSNRDRLEETYDEHRDRLMDRMRDEWESLREGEEFVGPREELALMAGDWAVRDLNSLEGWLGEEIHLVLWKGAKQDNAIPSSNTIKLGTRRPLKRKFRPIFRKRLVHEGNHLRGMSHSRDAREDGYYSDLWRDEYSDEVMREELGWDPPTSELWREYGEGRGDADEAPERRWRRGAKYRVFCTNCGWETDRKKRSKVVKRPDRYRCPECRSELEVERINVGPSIDEWMSWG